MALLTQALIILVAIEHFYILYLEMFCWTGSKARKIFNTSQAFSEQTQFMAKNQGLYNGFLAVGLCWGLLHNNPEFAWQIQLFFLLCIIVAAVYGSMTVKRSILFVQGLPALLALIALSFS